jgi:hypothetical protein
MPMTLISLPIKVNGQPLSPTNPFPADLVEQTGGDASQVSFTKIAGQTLSGHRVVTSNPDGTVGYASSQTLAHSIAPLWLTIAAANGGDQVELVAYGLVAEPSWSWTVGAPIFLSPNGVLTQTPPSLAAGDVFVLQVASPDTPTDVFFAPRTPIEL